MSTSAMSAMPTKPQMEDVSTVVRTAMVDGVGDLVGPRREGHDVVAGDGAHWRA